VLAQASAAEVLHSQTVADPGAMADELERAAELLATAAQPAHASGRQRHRLVDAWRIAGLLLRYDAAVRAVDADATALLNAAQRQAEILLATIGAEPDVPVCDGLADFLAAVPTISGAADAETAWRILAAAAAPICSWVQAFFHGGASSGSVLARRTNHPSRRWRSASDVERRTRHRRSRRSTQRVVLAGLMVRLVDVPEWAETCIIEPITRVDRTPLLCRSTSCDFRR